MWYRWIAACAVLAGVAATDDLVAQAAAGSTPATLVFSRKDPDLQRGLERVLNEAPFRQYARRRELSVALVDLSDTTRLRYAGVQDDRMRYAASLPKIAIMLAVFEEVDAGRIEYTPALRGKLEQMIRQSSNAVSTELIELVGFPTIERVLRDRRYQLYGRGRNGGLWVGRDYGGGVGLWRRDPIHNISHGATARQVARFMAMMERRMLVSEWASREMKDIMGHPAIHHKFVLGLDARPESDIYRKSGTWRNWHADAALVERDGKTYVAVALLESPTARGVLSRLILRLDDLIHRPNASPPTP